VSKAVFAVAFILSALTSSVALARGGGGGGGGAGHFMATPQMRGAPTVYKRAAPAPVVAAPRFAPRTFERMRVPRG